jgi:ferredoxin
MAKLRINGTDLEIAGRVTLLEAAQRAGADVPTLCHLKKTGQLATCMICVVRDHTSGRLVPACSTPAIDGMDIVTDSDEVRNARREILRLILNEHAGDCEGPCTSVCPASFRVPQMLRLVAADDLESAARLAKRELVFPATLGRACTAPCEKGCRRGGYDTPISIRQTHGTIAERNLSLRIEPGASTGKTVAIAGAGFAGLAAAWECRMKGHACTVYEKANVACAANRGSVPDELLDAEIAAIREIGTAFVFNCEIGAALPFEKLISETDALIVACPAPCEPDVKVFTAHENKMPVRAIAHGKEAALRVDAFLRNIPFQHAFNAQLGKLREEEKAAYGVERLNTVDIDAAFSIQREARRCLHCDCLKPASCKLRRYAEEYGLAPRLHRTMTRPAVEPVQRAGDIFFEPGKCIKCGICVELTRIAGEKLGMAFEGRGLASRVRVPFGGSLADGLGETARECAGACPTGALAFISEEDAT